MWSEAQGRIGTDDGVLVIRSIHVTYHLKLEAPDEKARADREAILERVHGFHRDYCPVARTLKGCVEITTELTLE